MLGVFLGQEYNNCHDFRFKKAWNWLQKSQDNRVFVYTWYHKSKLGYITSRYKSKKKNYESYLIMIMQ